MHDKIRKAIDELRLAMEEEGIDPRTGLGEELFVFSSSLIPLVNVDLFITNEGNDLLLAWRDDQYSGQGWHIPGGCVRLKERLEDRIQKTAQNEIGTKVIFDPVQIVVREDIMMDDRGWLENQLERSHNISFLYRCKLPEDFVLREHKHLKWFAYMPEDLLSQHKKLYGDIIFNFFKEFKG